MAKAKLSIPEQIQDMQNKGITFTYVDLKDAENFLKYNNYYFKLKSYGKNYDKYAATSKKGQYINLDFAYLQELSTLDMYLRKTILSMALDVEHALKTQLLYDLSNNEDEDGYQIVQQYLTADYLRIKSLHDKAGKSAASDLIRKRQENDDNYALWEIVEVMSFGEFIDLYNLYYSTYPSKHNDYSSFLLSIKFLRNAAAHNNCLLNSLKAPYHVAIHKTKEIQFEISKIKTISPNVREK
ncbi:MAG: Abi family protein [Clostridiales bacterium]|nr:Abi family protein [Clostridiales bacterium]